MLSIPFPGSKRYSYKAVKEIVESGGYDAVFEPFGGSCVLSVNLVNDGIVKRAVANDYDHFFDDYEEYLDLKDFIVNKCYSHGFVRTTGGSGAGAYRIYPDGRKESVKSVLLSPDHRAYLQKLIKDHVPKRLWGYFALGHNFTHSSVCTHDKINLNDFCEFNSYLKSDKQRSYIKALKNINLDHLDWRDFFEKYKSDMDSKTLLILDPPYVGTSKAERYKSGFTIQDTESLLEETLKLGVDFVFFNNRFEDITCWLRGVPFEVVLLKQRSVRSNLIRKDVMAYVRRT